ncbi:dUTP diphosphatase [Mesobacillus subterraneus]|uniref:dUTP diphosphatase n=1 Tax=Mesobacillus subterraneus TaxID=285983 RepID=UPI001CFDA02C|nr:dUTP diphosphatase [Mesobacillus subterraneus]WLR53572.1 dUTP diphosphatase [Mesobacillus subterraneus]
MKLIQMFEMQQALDNHIIVEHPELKNKDNLDWKVLALLVEVSECANEWRGFKKWSKDQEPRTYKSRAPYMDLDDADFYNPLLEEYVDGLHFILSIGLELGYKVEIASSQLKGTVIDQFIKIYDSVSNLLKEKNRFRYLDLLSHYKGLGEMLGFTWDQITAAYLAKNAVNHERQNNGY